MSNPKLSVLMAVYNDEKYVSQAIESILNQTFTDFEFIIINDGSKDKSLEIISQYAKSDERIVVIDQENMGLTKSLNKGIRLSRGQYIARMDSDDISHKDRFTKQIEFLEQNKDYALVGTNVVKIDENNNHLENNVTKYSYEDIKNRFKIGNCIAHGSVMLNKDLLKDMLYYDEDFKYSQDYRLWAKIAKKFKIANLRESLYDLRLHNESISIAKIEDQSIYAGIIAYEFESNTKIENIAYEVENNRNLRKKIGLVLLMRFSPNLAIKYFKITDIYFYAAILMKYFDLKKLKKWLK